MTCGIQPMSDGPHIAMLEYWRPVFGFESFYEISNIGRVRSLNTGRVLTAYVDRFGSGYLCVTLSVNKRARKRTVHGMVAETFIGQRPPKNECRHKDGSRTNARLSNLAYGTNKENWADKRAHGRATQGEKSGCAKLSEIQVRYIRSSALSSIALGRELGVASSTIRAVRLGQNWSFLE